MTDKRFYSKITHKIRVCDHPDQLALCESKPEIYVDLARLRRQVEARLRLDDNLVLDLGLRLGLITQD